MLRIMPRQKVYFDCFEQSARAGVEAATVLREMLGAPAEFEKHLARIEALEQVGDQSTAQVIETLNKNLATPFDRSDIRALIEALDDVLDGIDTVAHKLVMYRATKVRPEAHELAGLLAAEGPEVLRALEALRAGRSGKSVLGHCKTVHKLETDADKLLRRGITSLFDELKDPIELLKWKEILELLEATTDSYEHAVKVIEEVVRKHA
ncbi:MAG TPA: hypothetical protein DFS52_23840 [Myxococcales bacterium]|nr:hypothetical protein [Myxococcales bacterium]